MGKNSYLGGGTVIGFGTTSQAKSKGRSGGLNLSSPAEQQKMRLAAKKRRKKIAEQIAANEVVIKQLSDQWLAEKDGKK